MAVIGYTWVQLDGSSVQEPLLREAGSERDAVKCSHLRLRRVESDRQSELPLGISKKR